MNKDKMELEEAKIRLIRDITKPLACGDVCVVSISDVETVLQALENKEQEIKRLSCARTENEYGYTYTHLITKDRMAIIEKNKYLVELEDGKFVDIKELDETINDKKEMINKYIEILNKHKGKSRYIISNNRLEKLPDVVRAVSEYITPDTVIQMLENIREGL